MRIGAVLDTDQDTIVPLPDGPIAAIADTDSGQVTHLPNPAQTVRQGRRAVVTRLFVDSGVKAVLAVPGTFCEHSHELAQRHHLEFIPVEAGTRLSQVLADPEPYLKRRVRSLPVSLLFTHTGEAHAGPHRHHGPGSPEHA
ncbi:hypothetical protein U7230_14415 [Carboxydochorda subterranea]|uniref:Dinitrogenase iron-molybdenum cofactor biosynthesis domain-containing protein n=1 Tax=Carboxydichorda subterranea TaxID=3109565 RepID=A0ABZ1BXM1_9FIRM|nr:hypothetical protein [Limnochorda sp. L945t]WRP17255.1 hypothetical protein U7230_14415 [Limnochorda sp. L945t]